MSEMPKKKTITPKPEPKAGEIYFGWFPFDENINTEGDRRPLPHQQQQNITGKGRPFVIIQDAKNNEVWACKITKFTARSENDHEIQDRTGIKLKNTQTSTIRTKDIFLIPTSYIENINGKLSKKGKLSANDFQAIMNKPTTKDILGLTDQQTFNTPTQSTNPKPEQNNASPKPHKELHNKPETQTTKLDQEDKTIDVSTSVEQVTSQQVQNLVHESITPVATPSLNIQKSKPRTIDPKLAQRIQDIEKQLNNNKDDHTKT